MNTVQDWLKLFQQVNEDIKLAQEEQVVEIVDSPESIEYYASQIQNISDCSEQEAISIASQMVKLS